ncbi:DUF2332 domain-containing protein [Sphingomonas sp. SUN019]|uniref:DUF2332 domain-containing protein n=1 Tax=Sphingomonas sp. SUN019 TaxID=2937788 RepID=UPI002164C3D6|nr:DUF2332 domain-containing protein [Sphingomonas sp. SUN019]UVO50973.1 DUF2332 domain-containing protein [Sphingomonas sp. SUN019]
MGHEAENRQSFHVQAGYCTAMAAPVTARIATVLADALDRTSETGRRVLDWPGEPVADALVLRLIGGFHALHRRGVDPALSRVFTGEVADSASVIDTLRATLRTHDADLLPWLDGPPQTNEAGRSAGLMTGLLHIAEHYGPRVGLLEIGSSAGLNLLIDRYAFDLGGVRAGPGDAELTIRPDWRGPPPPAVPIAIESVRGVDIAPVDVRDSAPAERLEAYVWVENIERQERLATAIDMVRRHSVSLDQGDAAAWVEARLAEPQPAGVTRVLMHSVVWQYLPPPTQARIRDAMDAAGARATPDRPLGWVMMEPNRDLHRHEVRVRGWPGDRAMELVALTHAHGAWVEGLAPPYETRDYVMRRGPYEADATATP